MFPIIFKNIFVILMLTNFNNITYTMAQQYQQDQSSLPYTTEKSFVQFNEDHRINKMEAILNFKILKNKLINGEAPAWCATLTCTKDIIKYCLSRKILDDHCCCETRHVKDSLSWVPHTCFISDNNCRPPEGSCIKYKEIKECCCDKALAENWDYLFSSSTKSCTSLIRLIVPVIVISYINYLFNL